MRSSSTGLIIDTILVIADLEQSPALKNANKNKTFWKSTKKVLDDRGSLTKSQMDSYQEQKTKLRSNKRLDAKIYRFATSKIFVEGALFFHST